MENEDRRIRDAGESGGIGRRTRLRIVVTLPSIFAAISLEAAPIVVFAKL